MWLIGNISRQLRSHECSAQQQAYACQPQSTGYSEGRLRSGEIAKIMRLPDVQARLLASGADPVGSTPEEFAAVRKAEFAKYKKLVAKAGIKPIQ